VGGKNIKRYVEMRSVLLEAQCKDTPNDAREGERPLRSERSQEATKSSEMHAVKVPHATLGLKIAIQNP
jgi:hypothetical protein